METIKGIAQKYIEQNYTNELVSFCQQILELKECPYSANELSVGFSLIAEYEQKVMELREKELENAKEVVIPKVKTKE